MKSFVYAVALASVAAAPALAQDAEDEPTAEEQAALDAEKDAAAVADEGSDMTAEEEAEIKVDDGEGESSDEDMPGDDPA